MKKLIGIFVILLIGTAVFGQKYIRKFSFIEVREKFLDGTFDAVTVEENLRKYHVGDDYDWINYVNFIVDDRIYLLSYEPVDDRTKMGLDRQIYLYSKDINDYTSPWEPASEAVLTCFFDDGKNYTDVDFWWADRSNGSVGTINAVGDVREIIIGEYRMQNGSIVSDKKLKLVFTPISTNFYSVKKCYF